MQTIPLTNDHRQEMSVQLGQRVIALRVWWQPLSDAWYISVYDHTTLPIALGRQIAARRRLVKTPAFEGELTVIPVQAGSSEPIGRNAWEQTHRMHYLAPEEVQAVEWPT